VAVLVVSHIANDGESNWLEGASLLAVYLILSLLFYHLS
jgi:Ca2+:H+ antiporter